MELTPKLSIQRRKDNYQPNIITRSRQEFTLLEKKMMVLFINQIDFELVQPNQNLKFKIAVSDLAGSNREEIRSACFSILSKKIILEDGKNIHAVVPFPQVFYNEKEGEKKGSKAYIELTMFADVVPYFIELKNQYTRYSLEIMLNMSSVYSQRIFEIVMMYKGRGQYSFKYDTDELRNMLACKYPDWKDFRRRVLEPAQKELAEKAGLILDFMPIKKQGKRISEVTFEIKTEKQLAIEAVDTEFEQYKAMDIVRLIQTAAQLLTDYSFTDAQKEKILTDRALLLKFLEVDSKIVNGEIKGVRNPTAYIAECLGWSKKQ